MNTNLAFNGERRCYDLNDRQIALIIESLENYISVNEVYRFEMDVIKNALLFTNTLNDIVKDCKNTDKDPYETHLLPDH